MKYLIFFIFLFSANLIFGQSSHCLMFGANYPINFSESPMARGFGIDLAYQYSKTFSKDYSINTGIRFDLYEKFKAEAIGMDILIPIKLGYSINKSKVSCGLSLNASQFLSMGKKKGLDSEVGYIDINLYNLIKSQYFDMNTKRTLGVGFNLTVDYSLSKRNMLYIDFVTQKLDNEYVENTKYNYGIITIGFMHTL